MPEQLHEVGTGVEFAASHVMPGVEGPEGVLHSHDYRVDVVVSRSELDDQGMVCDLLLLDDALMRLRDQVADRDLEEIRPPDAEAVTVEVFAKWAHEFLSRSLAETGAETLAVRVWENEFAFGGYRDRIH